MNLRLALPLFALTLLALPTAHAEEITSPAIPTSEAPVMTVDAAPGLEIQDLTVGTGDELTFGHVAVVHYTGWLTDGRKFDSSRDPDPENPDAPIEPFKTAIPGRVITGWNQGLPGMHVGGVRKLTIPPDLAYGNQQRSELIGPGATLIFEVELIAIETYDPWSDEDESSATDLGEGLKIIDLKVGDGAEIIPEGEATAHYNGWLPDGTLFDSSIERNEEFEFALGGVIEGWQQGLEGMKVGGYRKIYIPSALAYAAAGAGDLIGPNQDLVFEVKLIDVPGAEAPVAPAKSAPWSADEEATARDLGEGLKVIDVKVGDGDEIKAGGSGTFHYTGWLLDGTKFDSSHDHGQPISFGLEQVIEGWQKGIPGMREGGIRKLYIPYALAYGEKAMGPIPAKSDLIFEVELIEVES